MSSTYTFCEYEKAWIPLKSRFKASGKVLVAIAVSTNQVWSMIPLCYMMYVKNIMVDPVAFCSHAAIFGLTVGYSLRVMRDVLRGYVRVKRLAPSELSEDGPCIIPERASVHITEIREGIPVIEHEQTFWGSGNKKVEHQDIIPCEMIDVRDGIPLYGPPEAKSKQTPLQHAIHLIISLFGHLLVAVIGPDGKRYKVLLNRRRSALVAFLATVVKQGKKIGRKELREKILKTLYRGVEESSLYQDKSKIQKAVHEVIHNIDASLPEIDLLKEWEGTPPYHDLALSKATMIDEQVHLVSWLRRVRAILAEEDTPIPELEDLRRAYELAIPAYGVGLFGLDLEEDLWMPPGDRVWMWAVEMHLEQRTSFLIFLGYAAYREQAASLHAPDPQTQDECLTRARDLYRAIIDAGSRIYPDVERCQAALQHIRELCEQLEDSATADIIAQMYVANIANWEQLARKYQK
jgi:hypothetical protein